MRYNKIICGNTLSILKTLPDESINCCVTSPPYWGLRDYGIEPVIWDGDKNCKHIWKEEITKRPNASGGKTDWVKEKLAIKGVDNYQEYVDYHKRETTSDFCSRCNAWRGSLGLEPTFELYIKHLSDIFDEIKRVLRKDGTCWVNLGDSYGGSGNASGHTKDTKNLGYKTSEMGATKGHTLKLTPKSLCLIPQRFAIEMVNRGWILRNTIIWHKPNCMPSSAKDRFTVDFEYVFFFVKNKKYWFEQQFEDVKQYSVDRLYRAVSNEHKWVNGPDGQTKHTFCKPRPNRSYKRYEKSNAPHRSEGSDHLVSPFDPLKGRNKRCVWGIPTTSFPEAHFAVYPESLIEPMIKAGCPRYLCKKCGEAREKIYKSKMDLSGENFNERQKKIEANIKSGGEKFKRDYLNDSEYKKRLENKEIEIIETDCGCNAGFESGIVLDPFMGAGTTAVVAKKQGKQYLGIEIKQEYIDMANKRIRKIPETLF